MWNAPQLPSACGFLFFIQHLAAEADSLPSVYAAFLCGILKTGTGNDEQGRAFQLPKQTIRLQAPPGEAHVSSDIVQPMLPA